MRSGTVAVVCCLLTVAQAAPRLFGQSVQDVERDNAQRQPAQQKAAADTVANGLYVRSHKWGNAKAAQNWQDDTQMASLPEGCPTASVVLSTTTRDVTVYVTPTAQTTEPCPDETPAPATSTEPCEDEITTTSELCPDETTPSLRNSTMPVKSSASPTSEPCPDESVMSNTTAPVVTIANSTAIRTVPTSMSTGPRTTVVVHMTKNMTMTSEPCPDDTPSPTTASTEPCEETTWTSTRATTRTFQVTPFSTTRMTTTQTTTCVIDTAMTPVTKSTMTSTPTASHPPTKTICEHDNQTGTPDKDTSYCGVKGQPAGVYFIAEFIEERSGVPVTEEGCYQFCDSVMEDTMGCQSYRFYLNELGAPRCDLYGMPVSHVIKDLDNNQAGKFYDLTCGCPTNQEWHNKMPAEHQAAQMSNKGNGIGNGNNKNSSAANSANQKYATTPAALAPAAAPKKEGGLLNLKLGPLSLGL
ncbi:hypothetical protein QQS21_003428 [Conoideocrella luteorostrata]|uniref:Apple domain-containing protein n=1 Tax=Conoideocrella luteorostrata TaxID=1105319 RepID=A0AAJ0CW40_9HYPO|nr:hypothetical protein QQS21_003428 [Conoideocrella luteorostrata]